MYQRILYYFVSFCILINVLDEHSFLPFGFTVCTSVRLKVLYYRLSFSKIPYDFVRKFGKIESAGAENKGK